MDTKKGVFVLKVFQKKHHIEVSAFERRGPVRDFVEHRFSQEEVHKHCQGITDLFKKSNSLGKVSAHDLRDLKALGQLLYDELLPLSAKQRLSKTQAEYLILDIDDKLNHLPWELLFDGNRFLCLRFSMGRIVHTKCDPKIAATVRRSFKLPLKMLILFDPQGNLGESYAEGEVSEGESILDCFAEQDLLAIDYKSSPIDSDYIKMYLRDYDFVHYAGHAEYDAEDPAKSGWLLSDRKLLATDIVKMAGDEKALPALIFSNACQSGITGKWKTANLYDLARAFLLTGVQHYLGTLWDILNKPSSHFALSFYKELAKENSVGEALKNARLGLIKEYGEDTIIWASYILYGDPTINYLKAASAKRETKEPLATTQSMAGLEQDIRRGPAPARSISPKRPSRLKKAFVLGGIVSAMLLIWMLGNLRHSQDDTLLKQRYSLALKYLNEGNYEAARNMSQKIEELSPQAGYSHILSGDELFNRGQIKAAIFEYTKAAEAAEAPNWEKALAYNRLGRGYSKQEEHEKALTNFDKAIDYDDQNPESYSNKGVILKKMGNYKAAQKQFDKALELNPQDRLAALFKKEAEQRIANLEDSARQRRVDKLINDLVEAYHRPKIIRPEAKPKANAPLTVTFLDFKCKGDMTGREGEDDYLLLKIMGYLGDTGKVKVVERQLIERLLEELKLGSSELANPQVSTKLGRILAAKLIITGNIIRAGGNIRVGMRLIETETTAIRGAIAESLDRKLPLDEIAERLANKIMEKITDELVVSD